MPSYQHGEAFALMKYSTADGTETELVWNSRDGVTPFVIPMRSGREGSHVNWKEDRCLPNYDPPDGTRVFVDCSPEASREYAEAMVEKYWDGIPGMPAMKDRWETKEEAVEVLLKDRSPGEPMLIEATLYKERLADGTLFVESPVPQTRPNFTSVPAGPDRFA